MNDADGLHIFDGVVNAQRSETVLQHFILPVAKSGLFRSHFRQRFGVVRGFWATFFTMASICCCEKVARIA